MSEIIRRIKPSKPDSNKIAKHIDAVLNNVDLENLVRELISLNLTPKQLFEFKLRLFNLNGCPRTDLKQELNSEIITRLETILNKLKNYITPQQFHEFLLDKFQIEISSPDPDSSTN